MVLTISNRSALISPKAVAISSAAITLITMILTRRGIKGFTIILSVQLASFEVNIVFSSTTWKNPNQISEFSFQCNSLLKGSRARNAETLGVVDPKFTQFGD